MICIHNIMQQDHIIPYHMHMICILEGYIYIYIYIYINITTIFTIIILCDIILIIVYHKIFLQCFSKIKYNIKNYILLESLMKHVRNIPFAAFSANICACSSNAFLAVSSLLFLKIFVHLLFAKSFASSNATIFRPISS